MVAYIIFHKMFYKRYKNNHNPLVLIPKIQYIPWNIHMFLFCFVLFWFVWPVYPYSSGLFPGHWSNQTYPLVSVKLLWRSRIKLTSAKPEQTLKNMTCIKNLLHICIIAIWQQKCGPTLAHVMAWCLTASSHYLNQCWLIIRKDQWQSSEGDCTRDISTINYFCIISLKITYLWFYQNLPGANEFRG